MMSPVCVNFVDVEPDPMSQFHFDGDCNCHQNQGPSQNPPRRQSLTVESFQTVLINYFVQSSSNYWNQGEKIQLLEPNFGFLGSGGKNNYWNSRQLLELFKTIGRSLNTKLTHIRTFSHKFSASQLA